MEFVSRCEACRKAEENLRNHPRQHGSTWADSENNFMFNQALVCHNGDGYKLSPHDWEALKEMRDYNVEFWGSIRKITSQKISSKRNYSLQKNIRQNIFFDLDNKIKKKNIFCQNPGIIFCHGFFSENLPIFNGLFYNKPALRTQ